MPRLHRDRNELQPRYQRPCWVITFPERCGPSVDAVGQAQPAPGRAPMATKVSGRQFALVSPTTAVILGALALVLLIASLPLSSLSHQLTFNDTSGGVGFTVFFGGVGVVVARRQPHNPIGWLLIGVVVLVGLSVNAGYYALLRYRLGHPGLPFAPVAVLLTPLWAAAIALLPPVILLFPDGRLTSRRWRWMLWIYAGLVACVLAVLCAPGARAPVSVDQPPRLRLAQASSAVDGPGRARLSDTALDGGRPYIGIILDVSGRLRERAAHHRAVRRQP
jgi:hypothetical protein